MNSLGETYSFQKVLESQKNGNNVLYMTKYINQNFPSYKKLGLIHSKTNNIIIGSSRVMQIKSELFLEPFYNAGGMINSDEELTNFLNEINPKIKSLIIGLDPWWYKNDYLSYSRKKVEENIFNRYIPIVSFFKILIDYSSIRNKNNFGALAQLENFGFRYDGSIKFRDSKIQSILDTKKYMDTGLPPKISDRIKNGLTLNFTHSSINIEVFEKQLNRIQAISNRVKNVIVYLPPFTDECIGLLKSTNEQKIFSDFIFNTMPKMLKERNISHIGVESPSDYILTDLYFADGVHPSEVFSAHQLIKHSKKFNLNVGIDSLKNLIDKQFCELLLDSLEYKANIY
tara:strand:+ start:439 stop:1464 length:1026 start_codon:yes stop_codon:yes gene_type:complete